MPFRPKKQQPQFADLKGILAQTRDTENPLYQTIQILIERLTQFQQVSNEVVDTKITEDDSVKKFASKFPTYHTKDDETSLLENSVQLLAGTGIIFDDSVPNERTIIVDTIAINTNHYDSPLTDGNVTSTQLIFALGDCIIVQVPV